jgi:cobalt-zinc-cadmium efflux system membrane fusion protein
MKKKYISLLVILFFLSLGINCSKKSQETVDTNTQISPAITKNAQILQRPLSKDQRKGQGPVAGGRGYGREEGRGFNRTNGISLTKEEKEAVQIKTIKAALKPIKSHLSALGKVIAHQHRKAIVSYPFSARISQIHIRVGDWVKKDQKLLTLQSEEVGSAKSEFYKAQTDYDLANINCKRAKRLFDHGAGAEKDYLVCSANLKVAESSLNAAEKKLHVLGFSEEQVKSIAESHQINPIISLFAPLEGKIINNNAIIGEMVDQETEILVIMDPRILWIDADIYEKDIAKIKKGQNVEVIVPAYPGEIFTGKISYISDVLNEETRTITVRTEVENKEMKLKPGMFADVKFFLSHQNKALVIPQEALLDDKGDTIVFINWRKRKRIY